MIHVTQGHEKGIGLEVFFKSTLFLPQFVLENFKLHACIDSCKDTLETLGIPYTINEDSIQFSEKLITFDSLNSKVKFESTGSLDQAVAQCGPKDILITLPTSKSQLECKGKSCAGYTEYFRHQFENTNISMLFKSYDLFVLLLSDHIPLNKVTTFIDEKLIKGKVELTLEAIKKYFSKYPEEVLFSGINPHSGENGILGTEDSLITDQIDFFNKKYPSIDFSGPHPGDTVHFNLNQEKTQLAVYAFHDQGLSFFKSKYGLFGINITMGLPFLRMSVDHGTAFPLYGKNQASPSGCLYVLNEAYKIHKNLGN